MYMPPLQAFLLIFLYLKPNLTLSLFFSGYSPSVLNRPSVVVMTTITAFTCYCACACNWFPGSKVGWLVGRTVGRPNVHFYALHEILGLAQARPTIILYSGKLRQAFNWRNGQIAKLRLSQKFPATR